MNNIDLSYVNIEYKKPIVYFTYKKEIELGFPEIRELISCAEQISDYTPYFTFADVRADVSVTNEGKRFLANMNNMPLFRGSAILVKSDLHKYAINFLAYFTNSKYPFKAFTEKDEAIIWLTQLPLV